MNLHDLLLGFAERIVAVLSSVGGDLGCFFWKDPKKCILPIQYKTLRMSSMRTFLLIPYTTTRSSTAGSSSCARGISSPADASFAACSRTLHIQSLGT